MEGLSGFISLVRGLIGLAGLDVQDDLFFLADLVALFFLAARLGPGAHCVQTYLGDQTGPVRNRHALLDPHGCRDHPDAVPQTHSGPLETIGRSVLRV